MSVLSLVHLISLQKKQQRATVAKPVQKNYKKALPVKPPLARAKSRLDFSHLKPAPFPALAAKTKPSDAEQFAIDVAQAAAKARGETVDATALEFGPRQPARRLVSAGEVVAAARKGGTV